MKKLYQDDLKIPLKRGSKLKCTSMGFFRLPSKPYKKERVLTYESAEDRISVWIAYMRRDELIGVGIMGGDCIRCLLRVRARYFLILHRELRKRGEQTMSLWLHHANASRWQVC